MIEKMHLIVIFLGLLACSNGYSIRRPVDWLKAGQLSPEIFMNSTELIEYNGYKAEIHSVTTSDGFILELHRILTAAGPRPVVLIQHGLLADSACFLFNGKNASLGYMLTDSGFDVWLGNSRGNTYSMKHVKFNASQEEFWDFSWQDMAERDLPAMVDYILKSTNQQNLIYIGHSQGTSIGFAGFIRNQTLANQIKLFIAVAPVARVGNAQGLTKVLGRFLKSDVDGLFKLFGRKGFFLNGTGNMIIAEDICDTESSAYVCSDVTQLMYGHGQDDYDWRRIPVYMAHTPSGTSTRNMVHFAQEVISGQFQYYDFGSALANMARYNQTTPPVIDIEQMDVPVALLSGSADFLADAVDVQYILSNVKRSVFNKQYTGWNHVDFILGQKSPVILFNDILKLIKK